MERECRSYKLWESFISNQLPWLQRSTNNRQESIKCMKLPHRTLFGIFSPIKTVYAAEPQENKDDNELTTIEKLGSRHSGPPTIIITDEDVEKYLKQETGKDRVKDLFTIREDKTYHPYLQNTFDIIKACAATVFIISSVFGAQAGKETYLSKHQHTKFETKFKAMRSYNDALIIGSMKMGFKMAIRASAFTAIFLLTAQTISTYRNQTSVLEYIAGGWVTGATLRANLGLKGMFAGGVFGSALGLAGGGCFYLLARTSNDTQEQRHYWEIQEKLRKDREYELLSQGEMFVPPSKDMPTLQPS